MSTHLQVSERFADLWPVMTDAEAGVLAARATSTTSLTGEVAVPLVNIARRRYDASQFGIVADGVNSQSTAIQTALGNAGLQELVFPKGDYGLGAQVLISRGDFRFVMEPGARFIRTAASNGIYVLGATPSSYTALTANALTGARSVAVGSASGFAKNQWVFVRSAQAISGHVVTTHNRGEWQRICGISGTTIHFYGSLLYDYNTANTAEIGIATFYENIIFEGLSMTTTTVPATTTRGLTMDYVANVKVTDFDFRDTRNLEGSDIASSVALNFNNVVDVTIERGRVLNQGYYGITLDYAARRVWMKDIHFSRNRHSVSLAESGTHGEPTDIYHENLVSEYSTLSGFDTHSYGDRIFYQNCTSRSSGDDGFQARTGGITYDNCKALYSTFDGFAGEASCPNLVYNNCESAKNNRYGIVTKSQDTTISGGNVHDNGVTTGSAGIHITGGSITGTRIVANNLRAMDFGSADTTGGMGHVTVNGVYAPGDATQTRLVNLPNVANYVYNKVTLANVYAAGYGGGSCAISANVARTEQPRVLGNTWIAYAAGAENQGVGTLVAGTVTINTTAVRQIAAVQSTTSSVPLYSRIILQKTATDGGNGALYVDSVTNGVSFVVKSTDGADTSTFTWLLEH